MSHIFGRWSSSMLPWESNFDVDFLFMVYNRNSAPLGVPPSISRSKNSDILRVNYQMINRKCNCESEVSSRQLAVLKHSIFRKCSSSKKYNCFEE